MVSALRTEQSVAVAERPTRPGLVARVRSGWWPTGILYLLTALLMRHYGVPLSTTLVFTLYIAAGIALPGVLVWRAVLRRNGSLAIDVGPGLAVGYAIEVLAYLPARWVGAPLAFLLAPAAVVVTFAAVPQLRGYWRRRTPVADRPPWQWSWSMTGLLGLVALWSFTHVLRFQGLTWPYYASPDSDMPAHLAILGEVKHHMPPEVPFVQGEPLLYHWFVYVEMAATSWATGIELQTLLYRLALVPMLVGTALLIAAIARRVTGVWWTGPVAVLITFFALAPNPYGWALPPFFRDTFGPVDDASLLRPVLWASPTQTFGALLFAALVLVLLDLLGERGRDRLRWVLFTVLLVTVMGAKATYLPLVLPALLLVAVVQLVTRRTLNRAALVAAGLTFACLLFAQFVLFGGATQGLRLDPFMTMRVWAMSAATGYATDPDPSLSRELLLAALFVACWICIWAGIAGLWRRLTQPTYVLFAGLGIGGISAITLLGHSGLSQGFFFQSARPYLSVLAAAGLAALLPNLRWRTAGLLAAAALAGVGLVLVIRALGGTSVPTIVDGGRAVAVALAWPYALLLGVVAAIGAGLYAARRRISPRLSGALVIAVLLGGALLTGYSRLYDATSTAIESGFVYTPASGTVAQGAMEAGRWLRDHSEPDDLVATNAHCYFPAEATCSNEHAWIAGYTERRVLVEGWGFTNTVHTLAIEQHVPDDFVPYWRPDVLADNDAAFIAPSADTVDRLRDKYHVRWMFVDERQGTPPAALTQFATLRFHSGRCDVYEINR